jgi:hypothetical protein
MARRRPTRTLLLAALFLVAIILRIWLATRETIANPDIMRYIDQAQGLARDPLTTLRAEVFHPLHAAAALLAHTLLHPFIADDRLAWLWSLRTVAILAAAVVTLEIAWLARLLGAPFWASIAASLAWLTARRTAVYGSDGLSDMLAISLFGGAMLTGLHALRRIPRSRMARARPSLDPRWIAAGTLAGLSYLTRPEGFVAVAILAASLVFLSVGRRSVSVRRPAWLERWKIFPRHPLAFKPAMASLLLLLVGAAIPALPYMLITHRFTGKVKGLAPDLAPTALAAQATAGGGGVSPLFVLPYIARELFETFFWPCTLVFCLAILIQPRPWGRPRLRVPVILWAATWTSAMAAVLLWPGKGYLDGRHTLILTFLLFAMLGLAIAIWEKPMRAWMGLWRRRPDAWARLPAALRWGGWPRTFALGVTAFTLLPGMVEMLGERPRADRQNLVDAAAWIHSHTRPDTVVADDQRLVGFYSGRRYAWWTGTLEKPELHQLEAFRRQNVSAPGAPATQPAPTPLLAGMTYDLGNTGSAPPALAIGPYRAVASFRSGDPPHDHLYVLYALPDDPVLADGRPAEPLAALPQPTTQASFAHP